jgi:hypothetical protein
VTGSLTVAGLGTFNGGLQANGTGISATNITATGTNTTTGLITAIGGITSNAGSSSNYVVFQSGGLSTATKLGLTQNVSAGGLSYMTGGTAGDFILLGTHATSANAAIVISCYDGAGTTNGGIRITQTNTQIGSANGLSTNTINGATSINGSLTLGSTKNIVMGTGATNSGLITTSQQTLNYTGSFTITAPYSQCYMLNPSGAALSTAITISIASGAIPDGTIITFRKWANPNTTANINFSVTGTNFVQSNSVAGGGTIMLTPTQYSTAIVFFSNNAYQLWIGS